MLSWEQIEVQGLSSNPRVQCKVRDMVGQSGTYASARCSFLSNQRRFFALGMGFNYKKLEAHVFVFHQSGLSSPLPPFKATTREGFNSLVGHIVGILSFKNEAGYHDDIDATRFQNIFCINNRYYEVVRLLYVHGTLRAGGRCTIVYSLQGTYTCGF